MKFQLQSFLLLQQHLIYFPSMRLFPGVFLSVHRVCRLHHAALLHERSHHRQRHHLLVTHRHAQRLSGRQSPRTGTAGLAGEDEDSGLSARSSAPGAGVISSLHNINNGNVTPRPSRTSHFDPRSTTRFHPDTIEDDEV